MIQILNLVSWGLDLLGMGIRLGKNVAKEMKKKPYLISPYVMLM